MALRNLGKRNLGNNTYDARIKITKDDCQHNYWDSSLNEIFHFYDMTKVMEGLVHFTLADLDDMDNLLYEGFTILRHEEQFAA